MTVYTSPGIIQPRYPLASSLQQFHTFVQQRSSDELRKWLLIGFAKGSFDPFLMSDEPSPVRQIQSACAELPVELRERFKDATTRATLEWQPEMTGKSVDSANETIYEPLLDLIDLAASIRASGVVTVLREKLVGYYQANLDMPRRVIGFMFAAIQGFAPLDEVREFFYKIYFYHYPGYLPIEPYAAQILLGLCTCDPGNYTEYLPRFIDMYQRNPGYYSIRHIINLFVSIVTLDGIARQFPALTYSSRVPFLQWLCCYDWSPAYLAPPIGKNPGENDYVLTIRDSSARPIPIALDQETYIKVLDIYEMREKKPRSPSPPGIAVRSLRLLLEVEEAEKAEEVGEVIC